MPVLARREIANRERATYKEQQAAQTARIEMEKALGLARAAGFAAQREAVGEMPTALVAVAGSGRRGPNQCGTGHPVWTVWPRV